ncbi:MAG: TIGR04282 family arsenosugar biosynthesis glycosyltransferase [Deltaproteobacteria bacterium]|nr:TIGR04282 family arsenosugar biosynthesis glycosyltransferase [Deltaproteobacteria bacterium]
MGRAPRPGAVKTRLCPPLTPVEAADFYACVLQDVLEDLARSARWDTWIAYAERSRGYFTRMRKHGIARLPQRGASLGERMHAVFADLCHAGYGPVVLVGSDIPTLASSSVERACELLEGGRCDVVLGPADDGGYYLIGLNRPAAGLFSGIAWSTAAVLRETLEKARQLGLRVRMVPGTYDVDVARDLERLRRDFSASSELCTHHPRTCAWLRRRNDPPAGHGPA